MSEGTDEVDYRIEVFDGYLCFCKLRKRIALLGMWRKLHYFSMALVVV